MAQFVLHSVIIFFCLFILLFLLGFVNYLYFRLYIYVTDLLKKKIFKNLVIFIYVMLIEILLSLYQSNSTYCLDNSARSTFCDSGFRVTSFSMKSGASLGEEGSSLMVHSCISRWDQWDL